MLLYIFLLLELRRGNFRTYNSNYLFKLKLRNIRSSVPLLSLSMVRINVASNLFPCRTNRPCSVSGANQVVVSRESFQNYNVSFHFVYSISHRLSPLIEQDHYVHSARDNIRAQNWKTETWLFLNRLFRRWILMKALHVKLSVRTARCLTLSNVNLSLPQLFDYDTTTVVCTDVVWGARLDCQIWICTLVALKAYACTIFKCQIIYGIRWQMETFSVLRERLTEGKIWFWSFNAVQLLSINIYTEIYVTLLSCKGRLLEYNTVICRHCVNSIMLWLSWRNTEATRIWLSFLFLLHN